MLPCSRALQCSHHRHDGNTLSISEEQISGSLVASKVKPAPNDTATWINVDQHGHFGNEHQPCGKSCVERAMFMVRYWLSDRAEAYCGMKQHPCWSLRSLHDAEDRRTGSWRGGSAGSTVDAGRLSIGWHPTRQRPGNGGQTDWNDHGSTIMAFWSWALYLVINGIESKTRLEEFRAVTCLAEAQPCGLASAFSWKMMAQTHAKGVSSEFIGKAEAFLLQRFTKYIPDLNTLTLTVMYAVYPCYLMVLEDPANGSMRTGVQNTNERMYVW